MINKVVHKKVKVGVAFVYEGGTQRTKYYEGIVYTTSIMGGENFIIFEDDTMINMKYVVTIEIIG